MEPTKPLPFLLWSDKTSLNIFQAWLITCLFAFVHVVQSMSNKIRTFVRMSKCWFFSKNHRWTILTDQWYFFSVVRNTFYYMNIFKAFHLSDLISLDILEYINRCINTGLWNRKQSERFTSRKSRKWHHDVGVDAGSGLVWENLRV